MIRDPHGRRKVRGIDVVTVVGKEPVAPFKKRWQIMSVGSGALAAGGVGPHVFEQLYMNLPDQERRGELLLRAIEAAHLGVERRDRVASAVVAENQLVAMRRRDTFLQRDLDERTQILFVRLDPDECFSHAGVLAQRSQIHPRLAELAGIPQQPSGFAAGLEIGRLNLPAQRLGQILQRRRQNHRQPQPPPSLHEPRIEQPMEILRLPKPFRQPLERRLRTDGLEVGFEFIELCGGHRAILDVAERSLVILAARIRQRYRR